MALLSKEKTITVTTVQPTAYGLIENPKLRIDAHAETQKHPSRKLIMVLTAIEWIISVYIALLVIGLFGWLISRPFVALGKLVEYFTGSGTATQRRLDRETRRRDMEKWAAGREKQRLLLLSRQGYSTRNTPQN